MQAPARRTIQQQRRSGGTNGNNGGGGNSGLRRPIGRIQPPVQSCGPCKLFNLVSSALQLYNYGLFSTKQQADVRPADYIYFLSIAIRAILKVQGLLVC